MAKNKILGLLSLFGYLGHSTARGLHRDTCGPNSPKVVLSIIKEVTVYPVYISTYCTEKTTITVDKGLTISVTEVPTQVETSGVVTTTCTHTKTVYPESHK